MNGFMYKVFKNRNDPENIHNTRETDQILKPATGLSRGVRSLLGGATPIRDGRCLGVGRGKGRSQTERKGTVQWPLLGLAL